MFNYIIKKISKEIKYNQFNLNFMFFKIIYFLYKMIKIN